MGFGGALSGSFSNEPDPTSTPSEPIPSQPPQQVSPLLAAIQKSKKKQQARKPASLAAAIARSKSPKQGGHKWG